MAAALVLRAVTALVLGTPPQPAGGGAAATTSLPALMAIKPVKNMNGLICFESAFYRAAAMVYDSSTTASPVGAEPLMAAMQQGARIVLGGGFEKLTAPAAAGTCVSYASTAFMGEVKVRVLPPLPHYFLSFPFLLC